jgi:hypothetical protein
VVRNDLKIIEFLHENGAIEKLIGEKMVRLACSQGKLNIVEYLLSKNYEFGGWLNTCIRLANSHGHLKMIKYLENYTNSHDK